MNTKNPYMGKQSSKLAPFLLKVPLYNFKNPRDVEQSLETEELCIAKIPNSKDLGYTHIVAIVYKDNEGDVFSLPLVQHHGELKEGTDEAMRIHSAMEVKEDLSKDPLPEIKKKKGWKFW